MQHIHIIHIRCCSCSWARALVHWHHGLASVVATAMPQGFQGTTSRRTLHQQHVQVAGLTGSQRALGAGPLTWQADNLMETRESMLQCSMLLSQCWLLQTFTNRTWPSEKVKSRRSATVAHCSRPLSGLTCSVQYQQYSSTLGHGSTSSHLTVIAGKLLVWVGCSIRNGREEHCATRTLSGGDATDIRTLQQPSLIDLHASQQHMHRNSTK